MGAKGEQTRENILATAERIILQRGYSGTSIEEIIGEAGITKGGFFYHFNGKNDLARSLILRYLDNDVTFFIGQFVVFFAHVQLLIKSGRPTFF